jgi:hypothetical protein
VPLTPNLSTVTLGGQYVDVAGNPIAGQVKFTPRAVLVDGVANQIVIPNTITVDLDATGTFTAVLPATNDASLSPVNFTYRVEEAFSGGRVYDIQLAASPANQNLADKVPVVLSTGDEVSLYVLLSVFNALVVRVDTIENVTDTVSSLITSINTATAQTAAAQAAAEAAEAKVLNPFVFLGV